MSKRKDNKESSSSNQYGKKSVLINIGWKMFERSSSLIITFLIQILLARILAPSDFGLAAMITVFVTLSTIFVSGGLSSALIQKKDADELDFSTIFWLNIGVSGILYLILFVTAPMISQFLGYPQLTLMLRVLSLKLLISAVNSIQTAYISKNMMFRFYFYSTLSGKIASGIVGITIAVLGGGAWALIGQALSLQFLETVVLWSKAKWRPRKKFSLERARNLYSFAWKIMLMTFIEAIRDQLRNLLIGKKYSSEALAYYDKGFLFPTNIVTNISSSLTAVMFPVLSNAQDNKDKALALCRRWLSVFTYSVLPVLVGLIMTANQLVSVILTEKWLPSVPYLQLACIAYIAWIIEVPIRETLKSLGHAGAILNMQVIKTIVALIVLFMVMNYGVMAIAISGVGLGLFNVTVSIYVGSKLFQYNLKRLLYDTLPTIALNILMGCSVYVVSQLTVSDKYLLIIQIFTGVIVYVFASIVTRNKNYLYVKELFQTVISRRRKSME
ncbi:lipopolysaccharide biosynthesis protein [Neobacillus niacini]|uniref:lipopolysaccharide biosynthesis protein n=1 Tax=Neobacillus niacini TaxID=86668 RepID=UPI0021CB2C41|nr:lipopolysaccharide biosynthesis protein [Neobacillus niacini]MCM3763931.1 lipopolysaccharide biosynthesis protein [Neobacillus niacini]